MLKNIYWRTLLIATASMTIVILALPVLSDDEITVTDNTFAVSGVTVFDGVELIENTTVVVESGLIKALGTNLEIGNIPIISGDGKTMIPGLIDSHTHNFSSALSDTIKFGVTTHLDMFTSPDFIVDMRAKREELGASSQADLFSAGMLATAPGGHGTQFGIPVDTLTGPDQAAPWVAKRIDEGSDFIKLVYMPRNSFFKSIDRATAAAVIKAAHAKGLLAVAHISTLKDAQEMLDDGINGLVHVFADQAVTPEFLAQAKRQNLFVIPTLAVSAAAAGQQAGVRLLDDERIAPYLNPTQRQQLAASFDGGDWPEFDYELAKSNTKKLHDAGIPLLAGSDAPNPGTTYGASLHQEMSALVDAGLTPVEALQSATSSPATAFQIKHRGRIAAGIRADFILVNGTPKGNIDTTKEISAIYKNGVEVPRSAATTAAVGKPIVSGVLSQFEQGLQTSSKLAWSETNDTMAGGSSDTAISLNLDTLNIVAEVKPGFMFPWSGAGVFSQSPISISEYSHVQFSIKGTPGVYRVMAFSGEQAGPPPTQRIQVTQDWQTHLLTLADFPGLDTDRFVGLAIVAGPALGKFEYSIQSVKLD